MCMYMYMYMYVYIYIYIYIHTYISIRQAPRAGAADSADRAAPSVN